MIHKRFLLIGILFVRFLTSGFSQISPGDLTGAHAHLEGITNCTKCHVLGNKVSNEKCLECHKEIKSRIDQKKGFHISPEVAGKDCFSCHSDHHGRNFDIIHFEKNRFNHQLTGYNLTGAHLKLECNACHNTELIRSSEILKKKKTFLGLSTDCKDCHQDVHQKTLSTNCASCHNTEAFAPAALFQHNKTDFPLKGKHQSVDCKKCHEITFTNNAVFQRFTGIPFNRCVNCHEDAHNNALGQNCSQCHTEESFNAFVGKNSFNHNQTDYPLQGKHRKVDCASCHKIGASSTPLNVFQDYNGRDFKNCATCHKDVHDSKFGGDCTSCHTVESFQKISAISQFEHNLTGYPLEGKHASVDCRKCHETKLTDPLEHDRCIDCHEDFHRGQFVLGTVKTDCNECHSVGGFEESSYTIEKHNEGPFPLSGSHLATACVSCHRKDDEWSFRNIGSTCNDCHIDVHKGFLSEKFYPEKRCTNCHSPDSWVSVSFDHSLTGFELIGKHAETTCVSCHKPINTGSPEIHIALSGLKSDCVSCHHNIHGQQFDVGGETDCRRCHGFDMWKPSNFDHSTARFVLDGAHKNVACAGCHKETLIEGDVAIQYRLEKFECADCHH